MINLFEGKKKITNILLVVLISLNFVPYLSFAEITIDQFKALTREEIQTLPSIPQFTNTELKTLSVSQLRYWNMRKTELELIQQQKDFEADRVARGLPPKLTTQEEKELEEEFRRKKEEQQRQFQVEYNQRNGIKNTSNPSSTAKPISFDLSSYKLIAPLPGLLPETIVIRDKGGKSGLGDYLNKLYTAGVAIATGLAVLMIVVGGIQYVSSDAISGKSDGIKRIQDALIGLLLAFMSYLLLNTINPDLVKNDLQLDDAPLNGASLTNGSLDWEGSLPNGEVLGVSRDGIEANRQMVLLQQEIAALNGELNDPNTSDARKAKINNEINVRLALMNQVGTRVLGVRAGLTGSSFKEQSMNDYALSLVNGSKLPQLNPRDAAKFFPNGQVTPQGWVNLIAGITSLESGFKPGLTYTENFKDKSGNYVVSTGFMQISQESARYYGFPGITTEQLKDPRVNLQVGVKILEKWISQDGVIAGGGPGNYLGGSRYWAVLR